MRKLIVSLLMMTATGLAMAGGDAAAGKDKSALCAACHGADGNSAVPNFPKLAGQHAEYTAKQLMDMKLKPAQGGRMVPEMTGIAESLSDQDIADLSAFYAEQAIQGGAAKEELVKKGEAVYRGGNLSAKTPACTGCHGPSAKGHKGAGFPSLAGQHADYIEKQLKAFRLAADEPNAPGARLNGGDERMMRDVASRMSDLEIRAVASFISGLR